MNLIHHHVHDPKVTGDDKHPQTVTRKTQEWEQKHITFLVERLGDKKFLLGDHYTAADLLITYDLVGAMYFKLSLENPVIAAYVARIRELPSYKLTYPGF